MVIKAVLLDLDQTLLDKQQTLETFSAYQYDHFALHLFVDLQTFQHTLITLNNQLIPKTALYRKLIRSSRLPDSYFEKLLHHLNSHLPEFSKGFPGLDTMLATLQHQRYKLGIVTNGRDFYQRHKIASLAIQQYMHLIVTSEGIKIRKPDLPIFQYALDRLNIPAAQTVFIGDNMEADILPAQALGMRTIHKTSMPSSNADICTDRLEELPQMIKLFSH